MVDDVGRAPLRADGLGKRYRRGWALRECGFETSGTGVRQGDFIAERGEIVANQTAKFGVVVDDEHAGTGRERSDC